MNKTVKIIASVLMACAFTVGVGFTAITPIGSVQTVSAAVLKQGSRGAEVKKVQTKLKNWGYYKGAVDGIFGDATAAQVREFKNLFDLGGDSEREYHIRAFE